MVQTLREKIGALFKRSELTKITEDSSVQKIADFYPVFFDFVFRKYGVKVTPEDRHNSLKNFVQQYRLPPPQVVFMEVQLSSLNQTIEEISPSEAQRLMGEQTTLRVLDVREDWELSMGTLPKSVPLTAELLDEILRNKNKEETFLLYCHFGIRSLDAASYLADRGFTKVYVLKGGIDSWAKEIDPSIPRYEGAYC